MHRVPFTFLPRVVAPLAIILAALAVASCGGSSSSPAPATSSAPTSTSLPTTANSVSMPSVGGLSASLSVGAGIPANTTITATSYSAVPSGAPALQSAARQLESLAGATGFFWIEFTVTNSFAANLLTSELVTLNGQPSTASFYLELDDITAGTPLISRVPGTYSGGSVSWTNGLGSNVTITVGHTYLFQFYYVAAATPTPSASATSTPTTSSQAFASASCSTSGTTTGTIASGSISSLPSTLTSPVVGGCSFSITTSSVIFTSVTAGTYGGSISLTAPSGLSLSYPTSNTCTQNSNCYDNAPPTGFHVADFVPLFYVTFQFSGFVGTSTSNNPGYNVVVNALTLGQNNGNFYAGSWTAFTSGSTPPAASSATFNGWSNNNAGPSFANIPFAVSTTSDTLTFPSYTCTGGASYCASSTYSSPESITIVVVVGYFTG